MQLLQILSPSACEPYSVDQPAATALDELPTDEEKPTASDDGTSTNQQGQDQTSSSLRVRTPQQVARSEQTTIEEFDIESSSQARGRSKQHHVGSRYALHFSPSLRRIRGRSRGACWLGRIHSYLPRDCPTPGVRLCPCGGEGEDNAIETLDCPAPPAFHCHACRGDANLSGLREAPSSHPPRRTAFPYRSSVS